MSDCIVDVEKDNAGRVLECEVCMVNAPPEPLEQAK